MRRAIRTLTITMPSPILENSLERRQTTNGGFFNIQVSEANPGVMHCGPNIARNDGPISALDNINSNATNINSYCLMENCSGILAPHCRRPISSLAAIY